MDDLDNPVSRGHSKAFLRHMLIQKEILGCQIASVHNLCFYLWLVKEARLQIIAETFTSWKDKTIREVMTRL